MVMIDTDILIWMFRKKPEIKIQFEELVRSVDGKIYVTPIQIAEIYAGIRDAERDQTAIFFRVIRHIPIDDKIGQLAGEFLNRYQKSHNVTISDALIAATSLLHHCRLWTLNKKHYPMMKTEDFWK